MEGFTDGSPVQHAEWMAPIILAYILFVLIANSGISVSRGCTLNKALYASSVPVPLCGLGPVRRALSIVLCTAALVALIPWGKIAHALGH